MREPGNHQERPVDAFFTCFMRLLQAMTKDSWGWASGRRFAGGDDLHDLLVLVADAVV
jgi:hypothetical protein